MRALLKSLCVVGVVAAVAAPARAEEVRSNRMTGMTVPAGSIATPDGGKTYDADGAPYSSHQRDYDSSNDFQLQGHGLNDSASARKPGDEKNKGDVK
jgi:hypothetical protein